MDIQQHQVYPFFDAVILSQADYIYMRGYSKGIGYPGRQEVAFPGSVIGGNAPHYQVPVVKHAFITECTPEMFIDFLQQAREKNNGTPFGVMINYPRHTTSIGFDGKKWLAANHNRHYYNENIDLLQAFFCEQGVHYKDGKIIASIEVVTGNEDSLDINTDAIAVNAKKSMFTPQILFIAQWGGYENITADCIKVIGQQAHTQEILLEWLTCKSPGGIPGFSMALQKGYSNTITVFIQKSMKVIATLSLPEKQKVGLLYKLFASIKTRGAPSFFVTLNNGHTDAIRAFIKGVSEALVMFDLSDKQKAELMYELFASIDVYGTPGFHRTLELGFVEAITAFIQECAAAIDKLPLSKIEKVKWLYQLLSACNENGTPGFRMTLWDASPDAITAFIRESAAAFAMLSPSETEIELKIETAKWLCELFASKKANRPGFFRILMNGNPETITVFIQECAAAIVALPLPKEQKFKLLYELLASKKRGKPGFYMTLFNGHLNATTVFIQECAIAVATLCDSEEEKAELLYRFFLLLENEKKSDFLQIIEFADPAVQATRKAFNEGIDQLPLSDEQKETLKYPKPDSVENMDIS